ncbi:hypothetical protein AABC73_29165 (plasmid) [Pseudomonas sp. G.S.17]|uniref:hypothetical protein n=1 Tax=Pseudomonas sp. G.S.17 TaxID=3137451 RepID=UPI00311CC3CA
MATKKPIDPLRASELERFERNLANFVKCDPEDGMYHRFMGILESQAVTLLACGVITRQGSVELLVRISDAQLEIKAMADNKTPTN